jgi:biopolymer transport protein ExbD
MKVRHKGSGSKIEQQMTPMIDVVFQLLIFFMLTLKIIEPEGDFNVNMPIGAPSTAQQDEPKLPDIKVRLKAATDGRLASLELGSRNLGNDSRAFERLNGEILKLIGRPGNPLTKDMEVEIDADYNLNYEYVISCVGACTGRMDPKSKSIIRYIEKIKFAPPRPAPGA